MYAGADVLPRSLCSLNILNLGDNFVKKVVSEIRKCRQLKGGFVPLDLIGGSAPKPSLCNLAPLAEGLDPPLQEGLVVGAPMMSSSGKKGLLVGGQMMSSSEREGLVVGRSGSRRPNDVFVWCFQQQTLNSHLYWQRIVM